MNPDLQNSNLDFTDTSLGFAFWPRRGPKAQGGATPVREVPPRGGRRWSRARVAAAERGGANMGVAAARVALVPGERGSARVEAGRRRQ